MGLPTRHARRIFRSPPVASTWHHAQYPASCSRLLGPKKENARNSKRCGCGERIWGTPEVVTGRGPSAGQAGRATHTKRCLTETTREGAEIRRKVLPVSGPESVSSGRLRKARDDNAQSEWPEGGPSEVAELRLVSAESQRLAQKRRLEPPPAFWNRLAAAGM